MQQVHGLCYWLTEWTITTSASWTDVLGNGHFQRGQPLLTNGLIWAPTVQALRQREGAGGS